MWVPSFWIVAFNSSRLSAMSRIWIAMGLLLLGQAIRLLRAGDSARSVDGFTSPSSQTALCYRSTRALKLPLKDAAGDQQQADDHQWDAGDRADDGHGQQPAHDHQHDAEQHGDQPPGQTDNRGDQPPE